MRKSVNGGGEGGRKTLVMARFALASNQLMMRCPSLLQEWNHNYLVTKLMCIQRAREVLLSGLYIHIVCILSPLVTVHFRSFATNCPKPQFTQEQ